MLDGPVIGPLRRFVLPVMQPWKTFLTCKTAEGIERSLAQLHQEIREFRPGPRGGNGYPIGDGRIVVFGRSETTDRWIVVYGGDFPLPHSEWSFAARVRPILEAARVSRWAIVWGRKPRDERQVVALFAPKWMVYDRYGTWFQHHTRKILKGSYHDGSLQADVSFRNAAAACSTQAGMGSTEACDQLVHATANSSACSPKAHQKNRDVDLLLCLLDFHEISWDFMILPRF